MIKRCWACSKELGVAHYCATDIKGVFCDADCLALGRKRRAPVAMLKQESADALAERSGFIEFTDPRYRHDVFICIRADSIQFVRESEYHGTEIGTPSGIVQVSGTVIEVMAMIHRRLTLDALTDEGYFAPNV